jgi:hypothetical protein
MLIMPAAHRPLATAWPVCYIIIIYNYIYIKFYLIYHISAVHDDPLMYGKIDCHFHHGAIHISLELSLWVGLGKPRSAAPSSRLRRRKGGEVNAQQLHGILPDTDGRTPRRSKKRNQKVKSKTRGCLKHWVYSSRYSHIARFLKNWSVPAQSCVSISYMEFQWLPDADPFHVLCVREDSVQGTLKLSKAKWSLFPCWSSSQVWNDEAGV